jgi:hypothetical protein
MTPEDVRLVVAGGDAETAIKVVDGTVEVVSSSKPLSPRQAASSVSWTRSSASCTEPSNR